MRFIVIIIAKIIRLNILQMKFGLFEILTLIGSLGLFLFGMKIMSEALQKVAGDKMRNILANMTSNRIKGVFTGLLVTTTIQSSSATTVMLVSFVNAGLLSLVGAVGVIMGANIGTTFTGWLVLMLGFKVSMSTLALPIIAIGVPFLFSKNRKSKSWGEFFIGFAILFIGLQFLKESVPDIKNNPQILEFLANYTDMGYWSVLIFLGIGTILTVIVQSSSATMALTLVMCANGWLNFEMAAAMILGENIGTTITANIAAMVANVSAKRAAVAHFIFNIFGVIWVLLLFPFFLMFVIKIMELGTDLFQTTPVSLIHGKEGDLMETTLGVASVPTGLAVFHTVFNIINTLFLIWFTNLIVTVVEKLVKQKKDETEEFRLKHIDTGLYSTSELSIIQARKEIVLFGTYVNKMFGYVKSYFAETNIKKAEILFEKIEKYEDISDRMEIEISTYLTKVSEGELSKEASVRIRAMLKLISDIESVADSCYTIAKIINKKKEKKAWFTPTLRENITKMFNMVEESITVMNENLESDYSHISIDKAFEVEDRINKYRHKLKHIHLRDIEKGEYKLETGILYADIYTQCEKLADYAINVSEAIANVTETVGDES
jgi:phosphate:Na+ symporter